MAPPALSTRLRMELDRLIEREPWSEAVHLLQTWGALELLDPALQMDRRWRRRLHRAGHLGVPLLPALLIGASDPVAVAQRLQLPQQQQHLLQQALDLMAWLEAGAPLADWSPADWTLALEGKGWSPQAVALTVAATHHCWRPLLRWSGRWRFRGGSGGAARGRTWWDCCCLRPWGRRWRISRFCWPAKHR